MIKRSEAPGNTLAFRIVSLDRATVTTLNQGSGGGAADGTLAALAEDAKPDVVGPGDVLSVTLYEVGVSLFAGQARGAAGTFDPSAHSERFPQVPVDERGNISLPYVGLIAVAGLTPVQIAQAIDQSLIAKSQMPQTLVTIATNVTNAAYVSGDVRRPSRLELTRARERLLDSVALAGGAAFPADDMLVRFSRRGQTVEQRLTTIGAGGLDDLVLIPGDRIELIRRPRSYLVFGATNHVSQVAFDAGAVSLAEAVARVGGPSDAAADPSAVFLFRDEGALDDPAAQPIIYRLNLLDPASYFIAQRFAMRDKDVIYIANAAANQPSKLVAIINQLFSPFITVRNVTR